MRCAILIAGFFIPGSLEMPPDVQYCFSEHHGSDCRDCDSTQYSDHRRYRCVPSVREGHGTGVMSGEIQAIEGKISELSYLPRLAADGGMVEARVLSGVKSTVVRLAPVGVLKQKQLALREGDSVFLNRYLGDGMKGEFLGATEVGRGARRVPLRDSQSRLVQ